MPHLNGYEATKAIRKLEALQADKHTPIIAVTAHTIAGDKERCLNSGMDDYLSKPLAIEALKAMLNKWGVTENETEIRQQA